MTTIPEIGGATGITGSRASLADNFETFLTLLTAQMKNQDPLSPIDSTEFVTQLVQFSGVEQQINQNQNLQTLIGLQIASSQTGAAAYLGREITAMSPDAELVEDGSVRWTYTLAHAAESARLVVTDGAGKVVFTGDAQTASGAHEFTWDGKDNSGTALPPGLYTLSVAALDAEGDEMSTLVQMRGRVTSVQFAGIEPTLMVGSIPVPLANVLSLREYAAPENA